MNLLSCAHSTAGFSPSNIPLENKPYTVIGTAEKELTWWTFDIAIIGIPLSRPPVEEAMQAILKEKEGNALVNIRHWMDKSVYLFMTRNRFHLKADVVRIDKPSK